MDTNAISFAGRRDARPRRILITADYCGYLRDALERGTAGETATGLKGLEGIHLFVNGAVGGLMSTTPSVSVRDPLTGQELQKPSHEKARAVGLQVAKRVLDRIAEGPGSGFVERLAIGVKAKTFNVALENKVFLLAGDLGFIGARPCGLAETPDGSAPAIPRAPGIPFLAR